MSGRGRGRGVRVAKPAICQMLAPGADRENGGAPIKEEQKNAPGRSPERNGFADIENNDAHNHLPSRVKDENDRKVNRTALHEQFQTNLPPIPPCHQNGSVSNSDFDKQNGCSKVISPPVSRMPVAMGRRPIPSMTNSVQMQPHDTTSSMYTDCKAASATAVPAMAAAAMAAPAMATPAMAAAATAVSTLVSVVTPHTLPVSQPSSCNVLPPSSASQPSPIEQHAHAKMKTTTMSSQDNSSPRQKPTPCKLPQTTPTKPAGISDDVGVCKYCSTDVDFRKVLEVGGETIDIKCSTAKLMREAFMVLEAYFKKKDTPAPQTRAPPGFPALPTSSSKRPTTNGLNSSPVLKTNTSISNVKAETTVPRPRRASRVIRQPLGPHYTAEELARAEAGQRRDELSAVQRRGCFKYVAQEKQSKFGSTELLVYERDFLYQCRDSPLSQQLPCDWDDIKSALPVLCTSNGFAIDEGDVYSDLDAQIRSMYDNPSMFSRPPPSTSNMESRTYNRSFSDGYLHKTAVSYDSYHSFDGPGC